MVQKPKFTQCEAGIICVNCELPYYEKNDVQECGIVTWKPEITQHLRRTITYDTGPLVRRGTDRHAQRFIQLAQIWKWF